MVEDATGEYTELVETIRVHSTAPGAARTHVAVVSDWLIARGMGYGLVTSTES